MRKRRLLKLACKVLGAALAVLAVAAAVAEWRLRRAEAAMERDWAEMLGGESFPEAFPRRGTNEVGYRLAWKVRPLGFSLEVPGEGREPPPSHAKRRYEEVAGEIGDLFRQLPAASSRGHWPWLSEVASAYLDAAEPLLEEALSEIAAGRSLEWKRDMAELGLDSPIPDGTGLMKLQRVLLAAAVRNIQDGREAQAETFLDLSWSLRRETDRDPFLISGLVSLAVLRWQLAVLRGMCHPSPIWRDRLQELDLRTSMRLALETEAYFYHRLQFWEGPLESVLEPFVFPPDPPRERPWLRPIVRWGLRDYAVRWHRALKALEEPPPRAFEPLAFCRDFEASVPRWQLVARRASSCTVEVWNRGLYRELDGELTEWVLTERIAPPASDGSWESRVLPGLRWWRETEKPNVEWRLQGGPLHPLYNEPPPAYSVRAGECAGP